MKNQNVLSGLNSRFRMTCFAFTLAEVLITIGIIGVVAAMTLPSLIANYQKNVINQQFKKSYSVMFNALRLMEADLGEVPDCYYGGLGSECKAFYDNLTSRMKVVKYCYQYAYRDGCIPKYNGFDTIKEYDDQIDFIMANCSGYSQSRILNTNSAYVFADGSIIFLYNPITYWTPLFALDVNGKKGPNKWGYDIFGFKWEYNGKNLILGTGACVPVEKGGRTSVEMLNEDIYK